MRLLYLLTDLAAAIFLYQLLMLIGTMRGGVPLSVVEGAGLRDSHGLYARPQLT